MIPINLSPDSPQLATVFLSRGSSKLLTSDNPVSCQRRATFFRNENEHGMMLKRQAVIEIWGLVCPDSVVEEQRDDEVRSSNHKSSTTPRGIHAQARRNFPITKTKKNKRSCQTKTLWAEPPSLLQLAYHLPSAVGISDQR